MGIIRYFLAISVVFAHSPSNFKILDGGLAVQCFYIISGFYMSLIYDKYNLSNLAFKNIFNFYKCRCLRIFPLYWFALFLTLIASLYIPGIITGLPNELNLFNKIIYYFQNIFIYGQDWLRFAFVENGQFVFNFDYFYNPLTAGSSFAIIGQAWSLSIELTFYFAAPFLLKLKNNKLIIICISSLVLKIFLENQPYQNWYNIRYSFFPAVLCMFLFGSLVQRNFYEKIKNIEHIAIKIVANCLLVVILLYGTFFRKIALTNINFWIFTILIIFSVSFIFKTYKNSKIDNFFGQLSYPVYIFHTLILSILTFLKVQNQYIVFFGIILVTLLSSMIVFLEKNAYFLSKYTVSRAER